MKGKFIYKVFSICLATIFLIHLGGLKSWAVDPIVWEEECYPTITRSSTDPNIILPTFVSSLEEAIVVFFGQYSMDPNTTKAAFHLYAGDNENNDLKENGNLMILGNILTYTPSLIEEGIPYTVRIESTATDIEKNPLDGNYNGTGGEGPADDWVMKFVIGGIPTDIGWSRIYDPDNLFTEGKVSSMIVDSQDRLWVGSEDGDICYFDGNSWSCETPFSDFTHIDSIPCMALDKEGCLWVGLNILDGGAIIPKLAKLVNNNWEVKDIDIIPSNEFIEGMAGDSQNNVWVVTTDSCILRDPNGQEINCNPPFGGVFISSLIIDGDNVWIGTMYNGIWRVHVLSRVWDDTYTYEINYPINTMAADSSGNMWVGTNHGLLKLDPSGQSPVCSEYGIADGLPGDFIHALSIDPDNALIWVGTSDGLGKFDIAAESGVHYTGDMASEISDEAINTLVINSRGEVWFGTDFGVQMRDEISPYVLQNESFPTNNAIITAQDIRIVFSEPMDHERTENAFILMEDNLSGQQIGGEFIWPNSHTLLFHPDSLLSPKTYIVSIGTLATDLTGNALNVLYSVSFQIKAKSTSGGKAPYFGDYYFPHQYLYKDIYQNYQFCDTYLDPMKYQQQQLRMQQLKYQQQQLLMQQHSSWNLNFQSGQFFGGLLQSWYQELLPTWSQQLNRQSSMLPDILLQPYYQLQCQYYQPQYSNYQPQCQYYRSQYQTWNFIDRQEQPLWNVQLESWKQSKIQLEQVSPIFRKKQQQNRLTQFNQQSYKPDNTQSQSSIQSQSSPQLPSSYQQQYQTWDYKDNQHQQALDLQKQQSLLHVQQQRSWSQIVQPYYR